MTLSPERRATIARLGGLTRAAANDRNQLAAARSTFRDSFLVGHACSVCPPLVNGGETEDERQSLAKTLRTIHYTRVARRRRQ